MYVNLYFIIFKNQLMKKSLLFFLVMLSIQGFGQSLKNLVSKTPKSSSTPNAILNIGVGIGTVYGYGVGSRTVIPPIGISYEKFFTGNISAGAYLGFSSEKYSDAFWGSSSVKTTYLIIAARGSYHFDLGVNKLDTYAGAMLGYNRAKVSFSDNAFNYGNFAAASGGLAYSAFIGARYKFSDKFRGFGELGYGIAWLQLGVSLDL